MGHIFISFHHEDARVAETIQELLKTLDYDVWMFTERLRAGTSWRAAIDEGIQKCAAQIVVFSENARTSEYVTYEWSYALGLDRPVIPVVIGDHTEGIHPRLEKQNPLDYNGVHFPDMLVGRLVREQARASQVYEIQSPPPSSATTFVEGNFYYVSHHTNDRPFVDDMAARLKKEVVMEAINLGEEFTGVSSWSPWHQNKDLAIRQSVALILVLSPQTRREPYNIYEWALALGSRKPVIPILLKPTPLHPRLEELQYLNFIRERQWSLLYRDLAHTAGRGGSGFELRRPHEATTTGPLSPRERGLVLRERITEPFRLYMSQGPEPGMSVTVSQDSLPLTIGRSTENTLVIPDMWTTNVSRRHAQIVRYYDGFAIEDRGSTNGTFVNGERLDGPHALQYGDIIDLANMVILECLRV
ncbi:MAG: TIR domain-containing protein [Chloroflexi bacterium]|nr:TIR domain-containing protein [Chloroflexota bacterium]